MKKAIVIFIVFFGLFIQKLVCAEEANDSLESHALFQVATLYSLGSGVFDGDFSYKDLMTKGDLGLGTFTALDGALIAVDGHYYQSTSDGHLRKVSPKMMTPFAQVIHFKPTLSLGLDHITSYAALDQELLANFPDKNRPYAFRIEGTFSEVTVRSIAKQSKPYPTLLEATKTQTVQTLKDVKGVAVGFWFPDSWQGVGMPGFHLHFATKDRKLGGHVLKIAVNQGVAQTQPVDTTEIYLPKTKAFANAKLNVAKLQKDLEKSESVSSP